MRLFQRKKSIKEVNYLEQIPIKLYEHEQNGENKVNILIPKFKNSTLSNFLVPKHKSKFLKVRLDEVGTKVWLQIDGQTSVNQICEGIKHSFGDKIPNPEQRLTDFLTKLYENKYIKFKGID